MNINIKSMEYIKYTNENEYNKLKIYWNNITKTLVKKDTAGLMISYCKRKQKMFDHNSWYYDNIEEYDSTNFINIRINYSIKWNNRISLWIDTYNSI
jgi:hypothetical protein